MKIDNNLPTGFGWADDNGNQHYDERPTPDNILDLDSSVNFPDGYKVNMSDTDPLSFYKFIIENKGKFGSQDQIDAYLNNYLQMLLRDQDWLRQSPVVQIQRLMAAGMSRSAAMKLLNSSGGAPGGSSVTPQSAGNVEQASSEQLNAINGSVQAASSLLQSIDQLFAIGSQMGLNKSTIALQSQQALLLSQQSQALSIGNEMTRAQYDALGDAATALQVLSNYKHKNPDYQVPSNINDWLSYCEKTPDAFLQYWSKQHLNKLQNPYYYAALKKSYEEYVKGDFDLETFKRQQIAHSRVAELGIPKIVADIANVGAQTETYQRSWENIKAQAAQAYANANKLSQEANRTYLQNEIDFTPDLETGVSPYRAKAKGEGDVAYYSGLLAAMDYNLEYNYKYPILVEDSLIELSAWQSLSENELEERKLMYINNYDNQQLACFILATKLANVEGFQEAHPGLNAIFDLYQSYNLLQDLLGGAAKAVPSFYFGRKSANFKKTFTP